MLNSDNYFAINIRKSETARRDICRGLALAENPFRLLMIAIGCIADMSGDGTFLSSCQQSLENIYGAGLEDPQYIEHRVSELNQSIDKLERCLDTCNENARERLHFALRLQRNPKEKSVRQILYLTVAIERDSPCFTRRLAIVITFDPVLFILVYLLFYICSLSLIILYTLKNV